MEKPVKYNSLERFQNDPQGVLDEVRTSGQPVLLTENGKAQMVVQEANAYQEMLELVDRAEAIAGIRRGLESMQRGEGQPAEVVFERIRQKYGIPQDV